MRMLNRRADKSKAQNNRSSFIDGNYDIPSFLDFTNVEHILRSTLIPLFD